jgi:RimJ/RimL family protein N-acetyltransferase
VKPILTDRLVIRNWEERDRDLFYDINSSDTVMEFFPFRRTRQEADAFMDRLRDGIAQKGYGFTGLALRETGEAIGLAGIAETDEAPAFKPLAVEIGWRLAPRHWGKGYVTEAGRALLAFGFEMLDLPEIVSFAVHDNNRSTAVMERLGMTPLPEYDFDHPRVPDSHPELKRHVFYILRREDWLTRADR